MDICRRRSLLITPTRTSWLISMICIRCRCLFENHIYSILYASANVSFFISCRCPLKIIYIMMICISCRCPLNSHIHYTLHTSANMSFRNENLPSTLPTNHTQPYLMAHINDSHYLQMPVEKSYILYTSADQSF